MFYFDSFAYGFLTHGGLLMASTLPAIYLLSRGLSGLSTIPMATVFALSGFIGSALAIIGVTKFANDNESFNIIISIAGASILLYNAFKAYQRSKDCNICYTKHKNYDLFFAFSMFWLNPHIYLDMIIVSSFVNKYSLQESLSFYIGFNIVTVIWYYGFALFAKSANNFIKNKIVHKCMHLLSSLILVVMATILILAIFKPSLNHFGHSHDIKHELHHKHNHDDDDKHSH